MHASHSTACKDKQAIQAGLQKRDSSTKPVPLFSQIGNNMDIRFGSEIQSSTAAQITDGEGARLYDSTIINGFIIVAY